MFYTLVLPEPFTLTTYWSNRVTFDDLSDFVPLLRMGACGCDYGHSYILKAVGGIFECSDQFLYASHVSVSECFFSGLQHFLHVKCGMRLPGNILIGMKSFIGLPIHTWLAITWCYVVKYPGGYDDRKGLKEPQSNLF